MGTHPIFESDFDCLTAFRMFLMLIASLFWGVTNPFLKNGAAGLENVTHPKLIMHMALKIKWLFSNLHFLVPFCVNQLGSVVFYYVLTQHPISLAVPVVNASTLLITVVTGHILCGERLSLRQGMGLVLVAVGVILCTLSNNL